MSYEDTNIYKNTETSIRLSVLNIFNLQSMWITKIGMSNFKHFINFKKGSIRKWAGNIVNIYGLRAGILHSNSST